MEYREKYKIYGPKQAFKQFVNLLLAENPNYYYVVRDRAVYANTNKEYIDLTRLLQRKKIEAALIKNDKELHYKIKKEKYSEIKDEINALKQHKDTFKDKDTKVETVITYSQFFTTLDTYYDQVADYIAEGNKYVIGKGMGTLKPSFVPRKTSTLKIDWGSSNKYKAELIAEGKIPQNKKKGIEGEPWLIYFTDDEWFKLKWLRPWKLGILLYKYVPAAGQKGLFTRCRKSILEKPYLKKIYNGL